MSIFKAPSKQASTAEDVRLTQTASHDFVLFKKSQVIKEERARIANKAKDVAREKLQAASVLDTGGTDYARLLIQAYTLEAFAEGLLD